MWPFGKETGQVHFSTNPERTVTDNGTIRDIASSIRDARYFTIMADEMTDASNREQVVECFRWVGSDFEDFVGFHKVDKVNADTLAAVIKDVVLRMNLDLHNCRGQCYDGAANMARSRTGTATQLRHVEERAICTHCYGHALNLAVADVVKQSKVIRDVLDTVGEINKLLKYSPRRDSLFEQLKSSVSPGTVGFRTRCPTQWTQGTQRLILRIVPVSLVTGVKAQMEKFDFLFGLCLGDCILRHTDNLSKTLQLPSLSAADNQQLAQLICNTLDCLRNQELFSLLWDKVSGMQEKLQIDQAMLPRRHKAPRQFDVGDGQGTFTESVEDYFRAEYYVVIDAALACIRQRLNQPGYQTYHCLENLLASALNGTDYQQDLNFIADFYGDDIDKVLH
ncbi:hypothetical protein EMCRGX_G005134 [Ephydatia muelleri]